MFKIIKSYYELVIFGDLVAFKIPATKTLNHQIAQKSLPGFYNNKYFKYSTLAHFIIVTLLNYLIQLL
jgi:hypothetical protein